MLKVTFIFISALAASGFAAACSSSESGAGPGDGASGDSAARTLSAASDVPIDGLSRADVAGFDDGDRLFDLALREPDGLGPLYVRTSCGACHEAGARGPGLVQKMVVVDADGVTPSLDQSLLPWGHGVRQGLAAGARTPIAPPADPRVKVTTRLGPPVLGRGYLEAVDDAEIARVEAEQAARTDGVHGRAHRVTFASVPNPDTTFGAFFTGESLVGRFGLKARIATIDEFVADAFQGDMGITTPMRPAELPNPDGLTDDAKPGVDLDIDHVNRIAFYLRRIAIPRRGASTDTQRALFDRTGCAACHAPSLRTRGDYPIAALAGVDAPLYTDVLLHDMGDALADGMTDADADPRAWRTAPLVGLRFSRTFLHDGRASSVAEAIALHDGEARASVDAFHALTADDRAALVQFVEGL